MPFENKKQLLIIVGAVAAGIVAVFLTSNYVKSSIEGQTAALAEQYEAKQKEMVVRDPAEKRPANGCLGAGIERVKSEQAEAMQKQMAAMQQAQQQHGMPAASGPSCKSPQAILGFKNTGGQTRGDGED